MILREAFPEVGFGTSGVRARVVDLSADVVSAYARSFAQHLAGTRAVASCVVGWDLRPSSPAIAAAVCAGLEVEGLMPALVGPLPTPAVALAGFTQGLPSVMVTGSHIPFDRNGIKFFTAGGEILKDDEAGIGARDVAALRTGGEALAAAVARWLEVIASIALAGHDDHASIDHPSDRHSSGVRAAGVAATGVAAADAARAYLARYQGLVPGGVLAGLRVGVYQHSGVGRDLLVTLLERLGSDVVPLARSDAFVAIDTEAVSAEDEARAAAWCSEHALDAVVSTDGDGDRPWLADERGRFVPGDVLGPLVAAWLGVRHVVTPLSSNSVAERSGWFDEVVRTRIGSPFVIAAMQELAQRAAPVAGYEANGGFLLQTPLRRSGWTLGPLPTRDAALPIVAVLAQRAESNLPVSRLRERLPARFTASGRLQDIDRARAVALLSELQRCADGFLTPLQRVLDRIDTTDGVRLMLRGDDVIHVRLSGNAPELRCYVEGASADVATRLRDAVLERVAQLLARP